MLNAGVCCLTYFCLPVFQFKLGISLMKLAFCMESWEALGADDELPGAAALEEGYRNIDEAIAIFEEVSAIWLG